MISIFYFSGTGNTAWAVRQLCDYLSERGEETKLYSIDIKQCPNDDEILHIIKNSEIIGIANPIYGANLPPIMIKFISRIKDIKSKNDIPAKQLFMLNTFGYVNAFGPVAAKKIWKRSGFDMFANINVRLTNNTSNKDQIEITKIRRKKAERELLKSAEVLLKKEKYIKGYGFYLLPGIIIRRITRPLIKDNYKNMFIERHLCDKCGICIENCPTQAINISGNEITFSPNCTACRRCVSLCPNKAVKQKRK